MGELTTFAISTFLGFFAIMNPIANTPIFFGLTANNSSAERKKIAQTACIVAFIIVILFILAGKYIFQLFGLTIPAFKITGGILLFYAGFQMLVSQKLKMRETNTQDNQNVAISPLAIPIIAGPGTIVTAMNGVTQAGPSQFLIVIGTFTSVILLSYLSFTLSEVIMKRLGANLIAVIGKLMGLILAIIGTGMIISGLKLAFFPLISAS